MLSEYLNMSIKISDILFEEVKLFNLFLFFLFLRNLFISKFTSDFYSAVSLNKLQIPSYVFNSWHICQLNFYRISLEIGD